MAQPLYFLPNVKTNDVAPGGNLERTVLSFHGIGDVFRDVEGVSKDCLVGDVISGPDGNQGTLLCYQTPSGRLPQRSRYDEAVQDWHKVSDKLYIGIDRDDPPCAEDMMRKRVAHGNVPPLNGYSVIVPIIRKLSGGTFLRTTYVMTDDGATTPVHPDDIPWWDLGEKCLTWILGGKLDSASATDRLEAAIAIIGRNYRFGVNEQNLLQWVSPESDLAIIGWAIDLPNENLDVVFDGLR